MIYRSASLRDELTFSDVNNVCILGHPPATLLYKPAGAETSRWRIRNVYALWWVSIRSGQMNMQNQLLTFQPLGSERLRALSPHPVAVCTRHRVRASALSARSIFRSGSGVTALLVVHTCKETSKSLFSILLISCNQTKIVKMSTYIHT